MQEYVDTLNRSFLAAEKKLGSDVMAAQFFQQFFTLYPETAQYFKGTDIEQFQGKKLNIIFTFIKDVFLHPNYAEVHISQEVIRHQMYGLKDKVYYFTLIDSLAMIVKTALEDEWTEEFESVWNDAAMAFKAIVSEAVDNYV